MYIVHSHTTDTIAVADLNGLDLQLLQLFIIIVFTDFCFFQYSKLKIKIYIFISSRTIEANELFYF